MGNLLIQRDDELDHSSYHYTKIGLEVSMVGLP
jgi:hypothetical protein